MLHHLLKTATALVVTSAVALMAGGTTDAQTVKKGAATKTAPVVTRPLDLNTATAKELQALPGVGEATATKIVAGRPYTKVDDLSRAGVPVRTIDGIRNRVVVVAPPPATAAPVRKKTVAPRAVTAPVRKKGAVVVTGPPVNLNTATEAQLEALPGVGPALAKGIIAGRPYKSVDDLARVKGLGPRRIATLRPHVTVVASPAAPAVATPPAGTRPAAKRPAGTRPAAPTPEPVVAPPPPPPPTPTATAPAATATPAKLVNLNTAAKEELDSLPGIGPVKAQAIIDARPFKTTEDVMKVKGIKEGEFAKIKDRITVQ